MSDSDDYISEEDMSEKEDDIDASERRRSPTKCPGHEKSKSTPPPVLSIATGREVHRYWYGRILCCEKCDHIDILDDVLWNCIRSPARNTKLNDRAFTISTIEGRECDLTGECCGGKETWRTDICEPDK